MSRPLTRTFVGPLIALLLIGVAARAADDSAQATAMLAQGQKFEREGQPDVAVQLYRAAALLAPSDPEPPRRAATVLFAQKKCSEAVTEYRTFLEVAPPALRRGPDWDTAMLNMAACMQADYGQVQVRVSADGSCAIDGGQSHDVTPAAPVAFSAAPGPHQVICTRPSAQPVTLPLTLAAKETQAVTATFVDAVATAPDDLLPPPDWLTAAPPSDATIIPPPPAALVKPPVLEVNSEAAGWVCFIDAAQPLAPDSSGVLVALLTPGEHAVVCKLEGKEPYKRKVFASPGDHLVLHLTFAPKSSAPPTTDSGAQQPVVPVALSLPPRAFEFQIGAGFGPGNGLFGIDVGARYKHFGFTLGSGLYPISAAGQFFFASGRTGFYASVGYMRIAHGLLVGGSETNGHEVYGLVGVDIRFASHFDVRIGAGGGYEFGNGGVSDGRGPLVFDLSVNFLP